MKLVLISDTHGDHADLHMPSADMVIHCGDYSPRGTLVDIVRFANWFGSLDYKYKLCISGNHDEEAERQPALTKNIFKDEGVFYLENELIEIEGYKFWGSPVTPEFNNWAFMKKRGDDIAKVWAQIPENIDVLITHGPPYEILDQPRWPHSQHVGCWDLLYHTKRVKPKIHCFGHLHHSHGTIEVDGIKFINCASMDEDYAIAHEPIVVEI